jgi:hypothetical protein
MCHGQWAFIGAIDISEIEHNHLTALAAQCKWPPIMIGQVDFWRGPWWANDSAFKGWLAGKRENDREDCKHSQNADPND